MFRLAGSEVVVLELVADLVGRGISVDLATREIGPDMVTEVEAAGAESRPIEAADPFDYDFIYVQHSLLAPLFADRDPPRGAQMPAVACGHLSPYEEYEAPGPVAEEALADFILANSPETAATLRDHGGAFAAAEVFSNPAPEGFFAAASPPSPIMRRLLLVSNHVPAELAEALSVLEERGLSVTRVGRQHTALRVTPDLIAAHDGVVTIGKTVQYSLAARRPVFCYDRFGGPGWLSPDNFETAAWHNFSGRGFDASSTAEDLVSRIADGYAPACEFACGIADARLKEFSLRLRMDRLLDRAGQCLADEGRRTARLALLSDPEFRRRLRGEANLMAIVGKEFAARRKLERKNLKKNKTEAVETASSRPGLLARMMRRA